MRKYFAGITPFNLVILEGGNMYLLKDKISLVLAGFRLTLHEKVSHNKDSFKIYGVSPSLQAPG